MFDAMQSRSDTTLPTPSTDEEEPRPLGYADNAKGTQGIIHALGESTSPLHTSRPRSVAGATQYASIVRELPARRHIEILVQDFFQNVAWHYDVVDESIFIGQLSQWNCLSYRQLQLAPDGLPPSLRSFPALLFQVIAQALLFQPEQHNKSLNDLKVTTDMKLSDRATEFSYAGHRIASLFGKNELSVTIVQAGLMRACFEKSTGAVVEAWHTLGTAIRDAQELGLHQIGLEQNPAAGIEDSSRDLARQVWLMLHLWDAHMAVVLGRPMSTRVESHSIPLPTLWNHNCDATRPPQPRDVILCGYHTAYKFLQDIHDLEKMDDCPLLVESIHESLIANISNLPTWAKPERVCRNESSWLSAALETMYTNVYFVLFALHRPFIFALSSSRARAFHAATQILESQARLFDKTEPLQHKAFGLIFTTFDATVLIVALHIRFPNEFADRLPVTKINLEWALERLKSLQASNKLATSAFTTIRRLYERMCAVDAPIRSFESCSRDAEDHGFMELEDSLLDVDWDAVLPLNLEDMLPPQPLSELLCDGSLSNNPAW